jgi:Family of unknown function (DUF5572)
MEAGVRPSSSALPSTDSIYQALSTYAFPQDPDFQAGLSSLTSDPTLSPSQLQETIFQAQCFYFARKYNLPPIDSEGYKTWLSVQGNRQLSAPETDEHPTHIAAQPLEQSAPTSSTNLPPKDADGPPYPASFESIVDLITRNQPIPGIEEIPDTVLDASLSAPNQTARRKKPWETDGIPGDVNTVLGDAVVGESEPTGVVGILQPIKKLEEGEGTNPGAREESPSGTEEATEPSSTG